MDGSNILKKIIPHPLGVRSNKFFLCPYVCTSHIWFPLNNLRSPLTNNLKFIHKIRDHKRKAKFNFRYYHFFYAGVMSPVYFSWKQLGIHVLLTYFSILLKLIFSLTTNVITQGVCPLVLHIIISISIEFRCVMFFFKIMVDWRCKLCEGAVIVVILW